MPKNPVVEVIEALNKNPDVMVFVCIALTVVVTGLYYAVRVIVTKRAE